jgi:putative MFS transporter
MHSGNSCGVATACVFPDMSSILERLDSSSLKVVHGFAALLCAVGFGIDLLEVSVTNALSAVFSAPPHSLSPSVLSWLLASVYIGAVIGTPFVGRIADRKGLKAALCGALLWLGVMSLLAAAQPSPARFGVFRFLSGIALGAYPPLMIAYLTAIAPASYRGLTIFWVCSLAYLAPPLGIFLIGWLTPLHPFDIEGWRWPFAVGGLAALGVGAVFIRLPESPRWLLTRGCRQEAERICLVIERSPVLSLPSLLKPRETKTDPPAVSTHLAAADRSKLKGTLTFVMVLYFLQPWSMAAFPLLTGPMLLKRGHRLSDTLLYIALATFGPALSTFIAGPLIDRLTRRVSLMLTCAVMLLAVGAFFSTDNPVPLTGAILIFTTGVAVYTPLMTTYGAELMPIARRASLTTLAWAGNRLAAVLVPLSVLPLFVAYGASAVGWEVTFALLASVLLVALAARKGPSAECMS